MDHEHGHDMMMSPSPSSYMKNMHDHNKMMMSHMTFYWGKDGEILFSGWPGTNTGMYALALVVVFLLTLLVEWLAGSRLVKPEGKGGVPRILRSLVHALRMGLAYLLMLAVMSFNVGLFLVVIVGHGLGQWLFGSIIKGSEDPGFPH